MKRFCQTERLNAMCASGSQLDWAEKTQHFCGNGFRARKFEDFSRAGLVRTAKMYAGAETQPAHRTIKYSRSKNPVHRKQAQPDIENNKCYTQRINQNQQ
jgi:hypothetical protein